MNFTKADPLCVAWCDHKAAAFAVRHWHYTRSMPTAPVVKIGVWEYGKFVGVVLFSRGATQNLGKPYKLLNTEVCELTRVALRTHRAPVTKILKIAIKLFQKNNPGIKLIVSFADTNEGHHGGIYQGGNWIYSGKTASEDFYVNSLGRRLHRRQVSATGRKAQYGIVRAVPKIDSLTKVKMMGKHRYLMPLSADVAATVSNFRQKYPKRATSIGADAPGFQSGEGGSQPTVALQSTDQDAGK